MDIQEVIDILENIKKEQENKKVLTFNPIKVQCLCACWNVKGKLTGVHVGDIDNITINSDVVIINGKK